MTTLRTHFIESRQVQGISAHTQEEYVRAVRQLAEFYHRSPNQITDEQIRQYLGYLKEQKHLADGTVMQLLFRRERDSRSFETPGIFRLTAT